METAADVITDNAEACALLDSRATADLMGAPLAGFMAYWMASMV